MTRSPVEVLLLALVLAVLSAFDSFAADSDTFIFNGEKAVNIRNPKEFVRIGEKLPIVQLRRRFGRYKVVSTAGEDCEICATVSIRGASLHVDYDASGIVVVAIRSQDKTSNDALGNRFGSSLRTAIGAGTAQCDAGDWTSCESPRISGLSYLVEEGPGCQLSVPRGAGETIIPTCARIGGFAIQKR
jgi:hypothetical protein